MINTITITSELSESLILELANPEKSGLAIKSIDGLGPSKASINVTELVTSDVSLFNSSRINYRTITFNILYVDCPTIEQSRLKTYKYFPIKGKIKITFQTDNRNVYCNGYVEDNKQIIFDKKSGCTITIVCPDPFFYTEGKKISDDSFIGINNLFSFPFFNDSLSENLIEFGEIPNYPEQTIWFDGEYSNGMIIDIYATKTVNNPTIYNIDTGESMSIDTDKIIKITKRAFSTGDRIIINTNKGQKSVTLLRDGEEINIISCLRSFKTWFTLKKGENKFTYKATSGGEAITISYDYAEAYEGI